METLTENCLEKYFDSAATTPLDQRVLDAMMPWLTNCWGNAHSIHRLGQEAHEAVENARQHVARLVGAADPSEIIFTSGASEANNTVINSFPKAAVSPFEHSSMKAPASRARCQVLKNDGWTLLPPEEPVELVSVMYVNSEIGAILDAPEAEGLVHRDIGQAAGKVPVNVANWDLASMSAHKFYGPKGVGALYARDGLWLKPIILGGSQEMGRRGSTLNVPGIVGMGKAAELALEEMEQNSSHAEKMRSVVMEELNQCPDVRLNAHTKNSPYILSVSFLDLEGETLVVEMDAQGYAISAGPACSSGGGIPSTVLLALKMELPWLRGTVRIGFSKYNTAESAQGLGRALRTTAERLRSLKA